MIKGYTEIERNAAKHKLNIFIPSIAEMFFVAVFFRLALTNDLLLDCDTGYHIRIGEYILNTLSIPSHDIFSFFSPPLPWIAFEWGSEVIMALIHKVSGLTGIVIFFAALIALIYYLLFRIIRKQTENIIIAAGVMLLVVISSSVHWLARPHIFSLLLLVIWYYLLDAYQYKNKNYLYLFPLLMLLWVNLHGAFFLGLILLGIYFVSNLIIAYAGKEDAKPQSRQKAGYLALILLISIMAGLINPNGYQNLLYPFSVLSSKFMVDHIVEFRSPNFHNAAEMPFALFLIVMVGLFALSRKRPNLIEFLLIIFITNMALYSIRNIPIFGIIIAPILVRQAESLFSEDCSRWKAFLKKRADNIAEIDVTAKGYLWCSVSVVLIIIAGMAGKIGYSFDKKLKPVAAVEFLKKEHIQGNVYNEYEFGDYMIYSVYPKYRVFIDGRADMYGTEIMKEYFQIQALGPGWEKVLDKYSINWIIDNSESALSKVLIGKVQWNLIYSDKVANIFVRNISENQYLISKYGSVRPMLANKDG